VECKHLVSRWVQRLSLDHFGGPYTLITSSPLAGITFTDTTVQAGLTYFYVVTAVDASGNESAYSNEASATVPIP
jgi:hypothetical protein